MKLDIKRKCPYCDKILDGVIETNGCDTNQPRPGDYTVCSGWLGYLEFTEKGFKRLELNKIKDKDAKRQLSIAVQRIKQWKHESSFLN